MNLIFTSFLDVGEDKNELDNELKSIIVTLLSAKKHNPSDSVLLVTTSATLALIDKEYCDILYDNQISIRPLHFTFFSPKKPGDVFSEKLFKLSNLLEFTDFNEYEKVMYISNNYYVLSSLEDIWKKTSSKIVLKEELIDQNIDKYYKHLNNKEETLTIYSGNLIALSSKNLKELSKSALDIYQRLNQKKIIFTDEDRTIISITMKENDSFKIYDASRHIQKEPINDKVLIYDINQKAVDELFIYYLKHKDLPSGKKLTKIIKASLKERKGFFRFLLSIFKKNRA